MTQTYTGGWQRTLTCPCGHSETFHAVVTSLVADQVQRAGWYVDETPQTQPIEAIEGICARCQRSERGAA